MVAAEDGGEDDDIYDLGYDLGDEAELRGLIHNAQPVLVFILYPKNLPTLVLGSPVLE